MKNKILLVITALSLLTISSCKDDKKESDKKVNKVEDKSFNIIMDVVVTKDDNFQIYYNEDGSDNYTGDKYVNVDVKGKPESQEIVFKLPEDAMPASLRFDVGSNKEQGEIKINAFKMKYFDKVFEAKDTLFFQYFGNNTSIKYIREKAIAVPLVNNPTGYDPIFSGTENLKNELKKLTK
jgi:hypothetical protein